MSLYFCNYNRTSFDSDFKTISIPTTDKAETLTLLNQELDNKIETAERDEKIAEYIKYIFLALAVITVVTIPLSLYIIGAAAIATLTLGIGLAAIFGSIGVIITPGVLYVIGDAIKERKSDTLNNIKEFKEDLAPYASGRGTKNIPVFSEAAWGVLNDFAEKERLKPRVIKATLDEKLPPELSSIILGLADLR